MHVDLEHSDTGMVIACNSICMATACSFLPFQCLPPTAVSITCSTRHPQPNNSPVPQDGRSSCLVPLRRQPTDHPSPSPPLPPIQVSSSLLHPSSSSSLFTLRSHHEKIFLLIPFVYFRSSSSTPPLASGTSSYTARLQQPISLHLHTLSSSGSLLTAKFIVQDAYLRISRGPCGHRPFGTFCLSGN